MRERERVKAAALIFCAGVLFFGLATQASATTYYVDSSITDTNVGSATPDFTTYNPTTFETTGGSASVYKTIADVAAKTFTAGDSVLFRKGQTFQKTSGTFEFQAGVTFGAYGSGNNPQFEGARVITGWALDSGSVYVASTSLGDHSYFMVWEGTVKGTRKTSLGEVASAGDFYLDDPADNLYYISRGGGDPDQYTMRADTNHYPFRIAGDNGRLENMVFAYAGASLLTNVYNSGVTSGWVISGVRFTNANQHGFQQFGGTAGSSFTFLSSEFDNNAGFGAVFGTSADGVVNTTIDGSSFHDNDWSGIVIGGIGSSVSSNNIIRNSTAYGNGQDGIGIDNDSADDLIENFVAYENGRLVDDGTGIKTFGVGTTIRYSVSYNNNLNFSTGHGFQSDVGAATTTYEYNIAYGNANGGISFTGNGHKIYNNSIYDNHNRNFGGGINTFGSGTFTNIEIKNNIIYNNGQSGVPGSRYQLYDAGRLNDTSNQIDYNLYYDTESHNNLLRFNGVTYATVAAFAVATTHEDHGIESDPLFTNASGNDFTLQSTSPAIDAGTNLGSTYQLGLSPSSTWPSGVLTLNQNSNGLGWEIGAYAYPVPPVRSQGSPSSNVPYGTASVTLSLQTDKAATCKYGTGANTSYSSISNTFATTGGTTHSQSLSVQSGNLYIYYIRCSDQDSIANSDDYAISFLVYGPSVSVGAGQVNIVPPASTSSSEISTGVAFSSGTSGSASSAAALMAEIAALKIKLAALQAQLASMNFSLNLTFTRNLELWSTGSDVKNLQLFLTSRNSGPAAQKLKSHGATTVFGFLTYNALKEFQKAAGITPASGYFGPKTRAYVNARE